MDTVQLPEPALADDGQSILFAVVAAGREVRASITRAALEQHFWLQPSADDRHMLRTFTSGRQRITALAERIALKTKADEIRLGTADFGK